MQLLIDITGWLGAAALLVAYGLVSAKRIEGDSTLYQSLNLVGGVCLLANTFYYGAFPSTAVNIVWIAIAVLTIVRRH